MDKGRGKGEALTTWMHGETMGLIRCCNMDSRLCGNDGMGTGINCSWWAGIPGGRL